MLAAVCASDMQLSDQRRQGSTSSSALMTILIASISLRLYSCHMQTASTAGVEVQVQLTRWEEFDQVAGHRVIWGSGAIPNDVVYFSVSDSLERLDTMNTTSPTCRHCGSDHLVRYGIAPNGKQKYRFHACGKQSRANPGSNAHSDA
jgi:hypothetical protein